jgi:hypothetical protein
MDDTVSQNPPQGNDEAPPQTAAPGSPAGKENTDTGRQAGEDTAIVEPMNDVMSPAFVSKLDPYFSTHSTAGRSEAP